MTRAWRLFEWGPNCTIIVIYRSIVAYTEGRADTYQLYSLRRRKGESCNYVLLISFKPSQRHFSENPVSLSKPVKSKVFGLTYDQE